MDSSAPTLAAMGSNPRHTIVVKYFTYCRYLLLHCEKDKNKTKERPGLAPIKNIGVIEI